MICFEVSPLLNSLIYNRKMGNDGGDIPGRKELVREKPKVQPPNAQSIAMGRARFCTLTNHPLQEPLAICRLGHLYNYEQILGALARKQLPSKYGYITKLSDIKKVIIDRASASSSNYIACPITKLQYNGFNKFVAFWSCGHVVSRKAFKEVQTESQVCVICQEPYQDKDLIDLNLEGEKLQNLRKNLIERKKKRERKNEEGEEQIKDTLKKKVKTDIHLSPMDRLGGQFRDIIRQRNNFKDLFKKSEEGAQRKKNTFVVDPTQVSSK